jgi:hypothetical protein
MFMHIWLMHWSYSFLCICIYNLVVEAPGSDGQPFVAMGVAGILSLIVTFITKDLYEN